LKLPGPHAPAHNPTSGHDRYGPTTYHEWADVLKLATLWSCAAIRRLAIRNLEPFLVRLPHQRLVLARRFKIEQWVESALIDLCVRTESLTEAELREMTYPDIALILAHLGNHVREEPSIPTHTTKERDRNKRTPSSIESQRITTISGGGNDASAGRENADSDSASGSEPRVKLARYTWTGWKGNYPVLPLFPSSSTAASGQPVEQPPSPQGSKLKEFWLKPSARTFHEGKEENGSVEQDETREGKGHQS